MQVAILIVMISLGMFAPATHAVQKFYMEDDCGRVIDMNDEDITAGRMFVTRRFRYRNRLSCYVTVVARRHKRLLVVFRRLDIEFESTCDDDYVKLLDGDSHESPVLSGFPERLCGDGDDIASYVTSGPNLTVYFKSDIQNRNSGFELVFTGFYESSSCHHDELRCGNGRCIDASLSCNGLDNCGDGSDECQVSYETVYAIILSVFLLTIVGVGLVTFYRKKKQNSKIREKGLPLRLSNRMSNVCYAADKEPQVFCIECRENGSDERFTTTRST